MKGTRSVLNNYPLCVCVCMGGDQPLLKDKILLIIKHCFQYNEPNFDVIKSHTHTHHSL